MAKKSKVRTSIKLKSSESSFFYTTTKSKKNTSNRLELKKYDPILKKHVLFKESK